MKVLIWGGEARYRADLPHAVQSLPLELVFCPREQPLESMFPQHADTVFLFVDAIAPVDDALIDRMPGLRLIHSEGVAYNAIDPGRPGRSGGAADPVQGGGHGLRRPGAG